MNTQKSKTAKVSSKILAEPGRNEVPLDELLLRIALKDDDAADASDAFKVVYKRFIEYVNNVSYQYFKTHNLDEENRQTLISNTFLTLYNRAGNLLNIANKKNETEKNKIVGAWLGRVMQYEALRMSEENTEYQQNMRFTLDIETNVQEDAEQEHDDVPATISKGYDADYADETEELLSKLEASSTDEQEIYEYTSPEMRCMNVVLLSLNPDTQRVLLKYYEYLDGKKHLPEEELKELCRDLNCLPDTINHIKHRGMEKLKKHTEALLKQHYPNYRVRGADDS